VLRRPFEPRQYTGGKKRDPLLATPSFVDDIAQKTGMSPTVIRDAIRVTNAISPEVRAAILDVPEIAGKRGALAAFAKLPASEQEALVAAVRRGEVKGVPKRAALTGKRARALHDAVDIITCLIAVPEIERLIRSLEGAGACSVLANALKRRLEQTSFTRPPVVPVVLAPRPGAVHWPQPQVINPGWHRAGDEGQFDHVGDVDRRDAEAEEYEPPVPEDDPAEHQPEPPVPEDEETPFTPLPEGQPPILTQEKSHADDE
jgi:hypothetical protein